MIRNIIALLLLSSFIIASNIAIIKKVSGETYVKRAGKSLRVKIGDSLQKGDIIITKKDGSIGVIFHDGTLLSLGENSVLSVDKYIFKPSTNDFAFDLNMKKGLATFESGKIGKLAPKVVHFIVPEGSIGIRGTKFYVEVK
jgi:hypothetical protein